ncbi:MAG: nicotinamide riboside transporter PnuC [Saprospiraceae bacterium]|nr:nicotinamide riboside transporter PnuC [Saprospiraceae bacterium]|tara:strand:- start:10679 stop:11236 length:558 start_codon:yes stop_codon:yes gene_type:complete
MNQLLILEVSATILGVIYLVLLIKEIIWCWLFGAVSSLLSIILFFQLQLYSEAILYSFYVVMAAYGYLIWKKGQDGKELPISDMMPSKKIISIAGGLILGLTLGFGMNKYTDADLPFADAQTTAFSFIATFLEAHKIVFGWIIWIVVNGATIALYGYKGLYFYSGLMVVYLALSVYGFLDWKKKM